MRDDQHERTIQRRSFIGWLIGAVPVAIGVMSLEKGSYSNYLKVDDDFLVVDGWVLPSAYFN